MKCKNEVFPSDVCRVIMWNNAVTQMIWQEYLDESVMLVCNSDFIILVTQSEEATTVPEHVTSTEI